MTPIEKAKELCNNFELIIIDANADSWTKEAIKCAIITVEEIIKALEITTGHLTIKPMLERQELQMDFDYWNNVLTELKKM